jgi:glucosamine--fructose-6-phosphate aminotransferase (isomerizing)
MCGIFGIVFGEERDDLGKILVNSAKRLVYRGYDSVGCATFDKNGKSDLRKEACKLEDAEKKLKFYEMKGIRGIAQLRWATFGAPSKINAQPHYDCDENMIGAHNGNIVNCIQLRESFIKEGHIVRSTNDGEILVHCIEKYYDLHKDMKKAIRLAAKDIKGDYSCVIMKNDENKIWAVKMGSSLFVGVDEKGEFICCSSDLPSILPLTNNILKIKDGEFIEFTNNSYTIRSVHRKTIIKRRPKKSSIKIKNAEKGNYEHFMLKEIHEQPERAKDLIDLLENSIYVEKFVRYLENADRIFLIGCGSSYNACVVGAYYLNKVAKIVAIPVIASQFVDLYGNSITERTVIICVSQSGETKDVINVINYCAEKKKGVILSLINTLGSTIMLKSKVYLPIACEPEISVPATKSFVNQLVALFYLSIKLAEKNGEHTKEYIEMFKKIPNLLQKTIEKTEKMCEKIAEELYKKHDFYCLGYGLSYGIALEGALKIKEITCSHCEGVYSSEFKHGPLSIVEKGYPVIFVTNKNEKHMIISHINEVSCRGGLVITIAQGHKDLKKYSDKFIEVPQSHYLLTPILNTIPLQLLAYYMSIKKNINPDFPRNLSKTLTVD